MVMVKEETRKGPWTEQEDLQLGCFVGLLGDRRWDFIAKVSGLKRTGKSCRLRWVNYLHPGLKRGRMSPQEERLVLELHSRWGNRWSRIARRLPGRTDNEIKNYWRTHMRKKAQERRKTSPAASAASPSSCLLDEAATAESAAQEGSGGAPGEEVEEVMPKGYPMDPIWNEIGSSDSSWLACYEEQHHGVAGSVSCPPAMGSPPWGGYSCDSLWKIDDEESKTLLPLGGLFSHISGHGGEL